MERVTLKDFSVGCADDSLKLLTGKILGCKAINLIFKCGFTLENNNVKMPPVCSADLCTYESKDVFTALRITIYLCWFTPVAFAESV